MIAFTESISESFIIGASVVAILFGLLNAFLVLRIKVNTVEENVMGLKDDRILARN